MRTFLRAARLAALPLALAIGFVTAASVLPASAVPVGSSWVEGTLVHVSTNNIKIKDDKTGQSLSFLLVPHFDRVFSGDGKTTVQMSTLRPGALVKVYYDQKALGIRHADRILVLNRMQQKVKVQKG
jgi:hypothetical protein